MDFLTKERPYAPFKSELEQFNHMFLPQFQRLYDKDRPIVPKIISTFDSSRKETSRAIRVTTGVCLLPNQTPFLCDFDDTLVDYTGRKETYARALNATNEQRRALTVLNRAARVLPFTGIHPERYSPHMQMIADTYIFTNPNDRDVKELLAEPTEDKARELIRTRILPMLSGTIKMEETEENKKHYFRETVHQALSLDWNRRPSIISEAVWEAFIEQMTKCVIPENEYPGFDLGNDLYFIPITFGSSDFQPEKVLDFITKVYEKTGRLPNEFIFFTRGRKAPFVQQLIGEYAHVSHRTPLILDDSPGQLQRYQQTLPSNSATLLRAVRLGSKRASTPTPNGIPEINMDEGKLNEKLATFAPNKS